METYRKDVSELRVLPPKFTIPLRVLKADILLYLLYIYMWAQETYNKRVETRTNIVSPESGNLAYNCT